MTIGPALVLSIILGLFHVSAYVFIRGRVGARVPLLLIAAILGAWAGDAVAARMAIDPLRVGEYHLISASVVAWLGIGLVAVLAGLVPERPPQTPRPVVETVLTRSGSSGGPDVDPAPSTARSREPEPQVPR